MPTEVLRIPGVRGANAYLVLGAGGVVLVDTGLPRNGGRIAAFLAARGVGASDLAAIVLTHADPDHGGSAAELAALTGAPVAIHAADAPVLAGGFTAAADKGPWRRASAGGRLRRLGHEVGMACMVRLPWPGNPWRRVRAGRLLADGDQVGGLLVRHVPGHTAGSIVLETGDGALLAGDAVFGDAAGRAHYPPRATALDPDRARAAAEALVAAGHPVIFPGHGEPIRGRRG